MHGLAAMVSLTLGAAPSGLSAASARSPKGAEGSALVFAVIGDSRPGHLDDLAHYPRQIIEQIYADVQQQSPRPAFAVATGDYMNNGPGHGTAAAQIEAYLGAAHRFIGPVFPTMGNHECANAVSSQCGPGLAQGETENYQAFLGGLLQKGLGIATPTPYYETRFASNDPAHPWTAKFLFVAANAWNDAQAQWLTQALLVPSTYTFVVRHERTLDDLFCAGAAASTAILAQHPPTLLFTGHSHEFAVYPTSAAGCPEIVVGNGGAPLNNPNGNYGYVVCQQRADQGIGCRSFDYQTNAPVGDSLSVSKSGVVLEGAR